MDAAFNRALIADLRAHGGEVTSGPFVGHPVLILVMLGARSGQARETPVAYTRSGDDYVVAASNAGKSANPAWFRNVLAHDEVVVEVLGERFRARPRLAHGEERDRLYASHAERLPNFAQYQKATSRTIPVIVLERVDGRYGAHVDGLEATMTIQPGCSGRYLEDFHTGDVYRSRLGRTITQADNIQFTLLTNNTNQIHFNAHYASFLEFKRPLVNSALTLSVVAGLMVHDTSENGFALGWDEIKLPNPLFEGETLYADTRVVEVRESRSRPGWGIVKVRQRGIKQDGTVVLEMVRSFMVPTRAAAPQVGHFPEPA